MREGFTIRSAEEKNAKAGYEARKLPDWYIAEPATLPGDEWYLRAFWRLSTCRQIGMGVGPIPWNCIVQYADRYGLEPAVSEMFIEVVREMDSAYLKWSNDQKADGKVAADGSIGV